MPQIPSFYARETLPTSGGTGARGGVVGVPTVAQPGMQDPGASALERSLGVLPEAVQQSGRIMVATEELQAHRQRVFDALNAKTAAVDARFPLQTLDARLQQENWQTAPAELEKQGKELLDARAATMTPEAKALFLREGTEYLAVLHGRATERQSQQTKQTTALTLAKTVQTSQEEYAAATNDYERLVAKGHAEESVQQLVEIGAIDGIAGAKLLAAHTDSLKLQDARVSVRTDPAAALQQITARMQKGEVTDPTIANVPQQYVADLWDEATKQLEHRVTLQTHQEARQKRTLQEQQNLLAQHYGSIVYKPNVTIPELLQAQRSIDADVRAQRLSETDQTRLSGHIQTLVTKLQDDVYKDRDLPEVKKSAILRVGMAQTPSDLDVAERWIGANEKSLSGETISTLRGKIEALRDKNNPLNDDYAKEAIRLFMAGAFPGGIVPAVLDKIDGNIAAKISQGGDLLRTELQRIYTTEGRDAMRTQALEVGRRYRDQYFQEGTGQGALPASMPDFFKGVQYYEDGLTVLGTLEGQISVEQRRKYFVDIKALPRKPSPSGIPNVPGLSKVPGYTPPKSPYAPLEQR